MPPVLDPFRFVWITIAGWMNQHQLHLIDYLREENRVLREQLGGRRLRLNDDQRRRLAGRAKRLGRKLLGEVASIVTPETWLAWHRKLMAQKYDGRAQRQPGRHLVKRPPGEKDPRGVTLRISRPVRLRRLACYVDGCIQGRFNLHECARCEQPLSGELALPGVLSSELFQLRRQVGQILYALCHRCPTCRQRIFFSRQKAHEGSCLQSWHLSFR